MTGRPARPVGPMRVRAALAVLQDPTTPEADGEAALARVLNAVRARRLRFAALGPSAEGLVALAARAVAPPGHGTGSTAVGGHRGAWRVTRWCRLAVLALADTPTAVVRAIVAPAHAVSFEVRGLAARHPAADASVWQAILDGSPGTAEGAGWISVAAQRGAATDPALRAQLEAKAAAWDGGTAHERRLAMLLRAELALAAAPAAFRDAFRALAAEPDALLRALEGASAAQRAVLTPPDVLPLLRAAAPRHRRAAQVALHRLGRAR